MTRAGHFVYLGRNPESLLALVRSDAVPTEVTVSVVQSVDAAVAQIRSPRTDCLIVDDVLEGTDIESVIPRLTAAVPATDIIVRVTSDEPQSFGTSLDIATLRAEATAAEQWTQLAEHLRPRSDTPSVQSAAEFDTPPETFTGTLHGYNPDADEMGAPADTLADSLADTPTLVDTFLNSILDIFFVIDLDRNFRLWNDSFNSVTGYSDEEIASLDPLDLIVEEHHDRALAGIEEIIESGEATAEFGIRTRDGMEIPYSFTGSLIQTDDTGAFISGIGRDISDRKERERELRHERDLRNRIIETAPMAIIVLDADGSILRANSRASKVLELPRSDMMKYAVDGDWQLYDDSGEQVAVDDNPVVRALRSGETVYGDKHRVEMPDGEKKWLSTNAAPITDETGVVSKAVVAIEDITELKERQQELSRRKTELDEAVAELRRSNAELERFAYVASHDLKEPLRMISNSLGLLERRYRDELDEDAKDFIDYATDGAERMRELINGLLQYSRTQRHDNSLEPVDCDAVIETVRSNLSVAIEETSAELAAEPLPTVPGDRNHLVQLFQNLISNAINYRGDAPPRIQISVEQSDEMYRFAVADNGRGIDADDTESVFDIFYSGTESDSTGIGLAICKKIVENHGGRIWADSTPDEGTTFYFTLPTERTAQSGYERSITSAVD